MTQKVIYTTMKVKTAAGISLLYRSDKLALLTDLRNPYIPDQVHPEWRQQFISTITNARVHRILEEKLSQFGTMIIYYTKIMPVHDDVLVACNMPKATTVIMSSVGEHNMTPWMIIHNIGHTILSRHLEVKRTILQMINQRKESFSINSLQDRLVKCASSRNHMIPNMNELIYELFTTWVWTGRAKSSNRAIAEYCDGKFASIMREHKDVMTFHRYRAPIRVSASAWLGELY